MIRLLRDVRACTICVDAPLGSALPHEPRPVLQVSETARILIAGQAPGTRVHASGKPFTDPSGDRLRQWMGIDEELFYDSERVAIVPMGFCFPGLDSKGRDLPPRRECAPAWRTRVLSHMPDLRLVLVIGQYAQKWHLGARMEKTLTETVANWRTYYDTLEPPVLALPHPSWRNNAWLRKNAWFERDLVPHLQSHVKQILR